MPSYKVYEDDKALAFLDINPVNDGHTLIIPKEHFETILDIPEDLLAYLHSISKKISAAVKSVTNADGLNIVQSNGRAAMQEVPHLHIHIMPRFDGDGVMPGLLRRGNREAENMKDVAEKINKMI